MKVPLLNMGESLYMSPRSVCGHLWLAKSVLDCLIFISPKVKFHHAFLIESRRPDSHMGEERVWSNSNLCPTQQAKNLTKSLPFQNTSQSMYSPTSLPDGNLTRPSPPMWESLACKTILHLLILQFGGHLDTLIVAQRALIDLILILVINCSIRDL